MDNSWFFRKFKVWMSKIVFRIGFIAFIITIGTMFSFTLERLFVSHEEVKRMERIELACMNGRIDKSFCDE